MGFEIYIPSNSKNKKEDFVKSFFQKNRLTLTISPGLFATIGNGQRVKILVDKAQPKVVLIQKEDEKEKSTAFIDVVGSKNKRISINWKECYFPADPEKNWKTTKCQFEKFMYNNQPALLVRLP